MVLYLNSAQSFLKWWRLDVICDHLASFLHFKSFTICSTTLVFRVSFVSDASGLHSSIVQLVYVSQTWDAPLMWVFIPEELKQISTCGCLWDDFVSFRQEVLQQAPSWVSSSDTTINEWKVNSWDYGDRFKWLHAITASWLSGYCWCTSFVLSLQLYFSLQL